MKRKLLFGVSFLLITGAFTSCQGISSCESCKWVTTDSATGQVTEASVETEYCGAQLITIKTKSIIDGTKKTVYQCH